MLGLFIGNRYFVNLCLVVKGTNHCNPISRTGTTSAHDSIERIFRPVNKKGLLLLLIIKYVSQIFLCVQVSDIKFAWIMLK